jgi:hypothetical protein
MPTKTRIVLPVFPSAALRKDWAKQKIKPNARLVINPRRINPAKIRTAV